MTGTSLDGIDVALVKITGTGLSMKAQLLGHHAQSMPDALRSTLMSLTSGEAREPIVYMRAARSLGEFHAQVLEQLLAGGLAPPIEQPVDFITAHGQTIWHAPRDTKEELGGGPKSWQLFDPWPIVRRLKLPVCYDLRQADLIAGGEGAPLTPIADWVMYRSDDPVRVVLNLGGVANGTVLYDSVDQIHAEDICVCNLIIDRSVQRMFPAKRYDEDGLLSDTVVCVDWVSELLKEPYMFVRDRHESLGRESLNDSWLNRFEDYCLGTDEDERYVISAAVDAVAQSIAAWLKIQMPYRLVLAGGGSRNQTLVNRIQSYSDMHRYTLLSDDLGIPCEAREAMGWAVLGALSQDGVPVSLPQVTGAKGPGVAGVWVYP